MLLETSVFLEGLQFTESLRRYDGEFWFSNMGAGRVMKTGLDEILLEFSLNQRAA
jgi:hypothetical protein